MGLPRGTSPPAPHLTRSLSASGEGQGEVGGVRSGAGGEVFPLTVTLSPREIILAAMIGGLMHARALARGWKDRVYESDWNVHVEAIAAEIAVAKALGIRYRPNLNGFKAPDVEHLHVRQTAHRDGSLIIRPGDPDGIYVLVTGQCPTFTVMGWIHSSDAKRPTIGEPPTAAQGRGSSRSGSCRGGYEKSLTASRDPRIITLVKSYARDV
jgi:hypothetical protein